MSSDEEIARLQTENAALTTEHDLLIQAHDAVVEKNIALTEQLAAREWQDISSAPKDVTVLVWLPKDEEYDGEVAMLQYVQVYGSTPQNPTNPSGDRQLKEEGREPYFEWRDHSGDSYQDYRPTLWQPLPAAPVSQQEKVG